MSEDVTLEVGDSAYPGRLNTAEDHSFLQDHERAIEETMAFLPE